MNKFEGMKPGTLFTVMGVEYEFVRDAGEIDQGNRNQWGRSEPGTHKAQKIVVRVNMRHRGWSHPKYVGFAHYITPIVKA